MALHGILPIAHLNLYLSSELSDQLLNDSLALVIPVVNRSSTGAHDLDSHHHGPSVLGDHFLHSENNVSGIGKSG